MFFFSYIIAQFILAVFLSSFFRKKKRIENITPVSSPYNLSLYLGKNEQKEDFFLTEKGLYQNILVTGTIGTGKTSSAMYPFTKQLMFYCASDSSRKLGMLILDVKGNYYSQIYEYAKSCLRLKDLICIDLSGTIRYNPLHKPHLKASVLADRLKSILLLFSPNNTESFWIDKAETILCECIKLCRLYNHGYVTFEEIHKLVVYPHYFEEKISILKNLFLSSSLSKEDNYHLFSALNFFEKEYYTLDERTLSILKAEISRITNLFISDYQVKNTFCSSKKDLNFYGFSQVVHKGKIVVLNMSIAHYKNLSKVIAAYLKLDFQTEVMSRLSSSSIRPVCFISDEFSEYVTASDANFFSQSREAKCINIVATQSYTSLQNTLNNLPCTKLIIQNLVNKLWFRTDDLMTIEDAQKQIGKEEKKKISQTISESAKETNFNYILKSFHSRDSNISESLNSYYQTDYIFDTNDFSQSLETFSCISFLSDGLKILKPQKLYLLPHFLKKGC